MTLLNLDDSIKKSIDWCFFNSYSHRRVIPLPLISHDEALSDDELIILANSIYYFYAPSWDRLISAFNIKYELLNSYNLVETIENEEVIHDIETGTNGGTVKKESDGSGSVESELNNTNSVWGFNSNSAVSDSAEGSSGNNSYTDTSTITDSINRNNSSNRNITKGGDNTKTTKGYTHLPQEAVEKELMLARHSLYSTLIEDAEKYLLLFIY